jgi:hypothetical protein|tara:strand:- start:12 stop:674 length:663 start_codon:yes stop_codon:yes gene_type:complete
MGYYKRNNGFTRGPAWAAEPFQHINHEFWPDLTKLREEAIAVRESNEHRLTVQVPNGRDDVDDVVLDFQFVSDHTPVLQEHWQNFQDWFGETGAAYCQYFYIDANAEYEWHRDNILRDIEYDPRKIIETTTAEIPDKYKVDSQTNFPVQCAINVVLTEDGSECEFMDFGSYKYTAGILNTSHLHRVFPSEQRILARISFLEMLYEEVIHRVRKLEKRNKK